MIGQISWDPDRNFFVVPYIQHPVTWYGLLFALGFLVGYFLTRKIFSNFLASPDRTETEAKLAAVQLTDRLALVTVLGTVIGARLGYVFFYGWPHYVKEPLEIFKVWEGGLASHGGVVGILAGLLIFFFWNRKKYPEI
ncbi:MAG: Prolipoprotein diacylglyceryl transferase, partial [Chlamydiae bacterium]|nr:Prolipoprotein diacylglyceryl transferase [Chlamydiota bacterium]